ncbi:NAD(P)-dependent alcohol dehydrogenase [Aliifodinibius sp. S!AR15-10]|uniref:NAD(P)-dependent alcohol dehydrogenase n=1 Tax=Aliifodinibius sp. S!AR15-10 TaxID=2950437 RepID=UPI002859E425|nr:NAD(P)-dependent alcohol dehydrogenase [Aliifodinibius sp. S!AR15-10]MDR8391051.1 NAD(P)-dependent alcohol dehydrogenase [Aliifodinibius sp. S!AR15-10]
MKAVVANQYGSPDILQLKEVDKPVNADNEVLVKVYATTVNRTDCAILRAKPFIMRFILGLFRPRNSITGTDFAGEVEAVGNAVTSFEVGDRVFGFDDGGLRSHAQYMTFPEDKGIGTMPENVTYEQAAASIEGAHYAYNFINKVELNHGDKVLVNGATGAIGSAAVQLLTYYDARVTAVCGTENIELVKSLGAEKAIDYQKEDFTKINEQFDFVFDTVGKSSFAKCKPLLKSRGAYISSELGDMVQNPILALVTPLMGGKTVRFPFPYDVKKSALLVKKLIEEGHFTPVIDRKYPLDQIADAYRYVEKGFKTGNVVITVD